MLKVREFKTEEDMYKFLGSGKAVKRFRTKLNNEYGVDACTVKIDELSIFIKEKKVKK